MATNQSAARAFNEVVFHGKPKVVRALLSGLMLGAGPRGHVFYSFQDGVQQRRQSGEARPSRRRARPDCHLVVDGEASAFLKQMSRRSPTETGLVIAANRHVRSATMAFEYHAYAPQYNAEIVKLLQNLPKGVKLEGYRHDVKLDPTAKGVEAYSRGPRFRG